jgi:hypothetical protein
MRRRQGCASLLVSGVSAGVYDPDAMAVSATTKTDDEDGGRGSMAAWTWTAAMTRTVTRQRAVAAMTRVSQQAQRRRGAGASASNDRADRIFKSIPLTLRPRLTLDDVFSASEAARKDDAAAAAHDGVPRTGAAGQVSQET